MDLQPEMFVDLDLMETCINKCAIIHHCPQLSSVIYGELHHDTSSKSSIHTDHYILHPVDLTDTNRLKEFIESSTLNKE